MTTNLTKAGITSAGPQPVGTPTLDAYTDTRIRQEPFMPTQPTGDELAAKGLDTERSVLPVNDPALDDQVEHPDEGGDAPVDIRTIKEQVDARLAEIRESLETARTSRALTDRAHRTETENLAKRGIERRARINAEIKTLLAEEAELARVAKSFEPRKPRSPRS